MASRWLASVAFTALAACGGSATVDDVVTGDAHDGARDTGGDAVTHLDAAAQDVAPGDDVAAGMDVAQDDIAMPRDVTTPTDVTTPRDVTTPTDAMTPRDVTVTDSGSACRPYVDQHAPERTSCTFSAGSHATATMGDGAAARTAIQHLIILLHENRSMDHFFGYTGHGIEGVPATYTNPGSSGAAVRPYRYTSGCACDITHDQGHIQSEWDHGAMDGFVRTDGMGAFGYYNDADHPFYTWLLTTFATSDRYFCSALGDTGHNRHTLWHARSNYTGASIFPQLDAAHVNWVNFYDRSEPLYNDLNGATAEAAHLRHDVGLTAFYAALRDPTGASLPQLSIIDQSADEHPTGDIHRGEAQTRTLVQNVLASPSWSHIALIYTYDEGGGFFDHVPPPAACIAATGDATEATYDHLGIRVPIAVVSPYAIPGFVSHVTHSHTSITRLIELLYDLPALTKRDANSDALLDLFDFGCPRLMTAPTGAPAAGAAGCPASCASGP